MEKFIGVKTSFVGLHRWKDAPEDKVIKFLRDLHRHQFHIQLLFAVTHEDRQLEFFETELYVREIVNLLYGRDEIKNLGNRSCETIGMDLYEHMTDPYRKSLQSIKVMEDEENFALLKFS